MRLKSKTLLVLSVGALNQETTSGEAGYIAGIVVAFLVLCYLVYSLVKPEKF